MQGRYHAAVLVMGQQVLGTGGAPRSQAEELFLFPNISTKLPAVEMIPFFFRIHRNHHSSPLTSSFVVMETRPSGRDAVEHPGVGGCISGAVAWAQS